MLSFPCLEIRKYGNAKEREVLASLAQQQAQFHQGVSKIQTRPLKVIMLRVNTCLVFVFCCCFLCCVCVFFWGVP